MNQKITLLTDSTCDLPQALIEQYNIEIIPLTIVWGNEQFLDGVEIQPQEFYQRLNTDPVLPTTSQPTPKAILEAYERAEEHGAEEIMFITISSAMSGTHEVAKLAANNFHLPVHIIDSKANSMSLGWQVLAAGRARENGADVAAMRKAVERVREKMVYIITLDTLEYLHKGGRIGGAKRFIGSLLNLKPQISVNHKTGEVEGGRQSRTRKRSLNDLYQDFFAQLDTSKKMRIAVLHNAAFSTAKKLAERVKKEFAPEELLISIVSPILGVHTGPRAIALCGYTEG